MTMRTIEKTIYKYDELPTEAARAKARDWYRETGMNYDWWDAVYEDAKTILATMGFHDVDISFSGFGCQGDGASFTGRYGGRVFPLGADSASELRRCCPQEAEVLAVAEALDAMQSRYDGRLTARIERDRYGYTRYCHGGTMEAFLYDDGGDEEVPQADELEFRELARKMARWIYRSLEKDWEHLTGDECVASVIQDNEYEFYADGSPSRD
jgi:hypothetical protein